MHLADSPRVIRLGMKSRGTPSSPTIGSSIKFAPTKPPSKWRTSPFLPGIQMASLAMPDIHWGYGFCIGGVSATDPAEGGVVSPGGVGLRYQLRCAADADHVCTRKKCIRDLAR